MSDTQALESPEDDRIYHPEPGETQLTFRAVAAGVGIGAVAGCMNIYLGLKIGWTVGGSLMAAILGFALFQVLRPKRPYGVLETNITQTAGSGAGTMASAGGFVAPIPALLMLSRVKLSVVYSEVINGIPEGQESAVSKLLDIEFPMHTMFLWALSVAFLGVCYAVPLRRQYVLVDKLRFPTGTATAETIKSMYAKAGEAVAKAKVLLITALLAAAWTLIGYFVPGTEHPPIEYLNNVAIPIFGVLSAWTLSVVTGPMLFGAGFLIGPRVATSLFLGAICAWGLLGPIAQDMGWATGHIMSYKNGPRGWILWPGVAIMAADALTSLALQWKTVLNTFTGGNPAKSTDASDETAAIEDEQSIPNSWWMGGLAFGATLTVVVTFLVFDIPIYLSLMAIALSWLLAAIAVRSTGETDINPVGGMGKVTQLVYGGVAPGQVGTNLMAAAISGAGASQAGDMMQDLKTGHLLGAAPRKQFIAQLIGVCFGVLAVVPIFFVFDMAYDIGATSQLPAPAAHAWKAMAEVLGKGLDALPKNAGWAALAGGLFGMTIPLLRKYVPRVRPLLPNGLAFGIAFIVPAFYSIEMFAGMLFYIWWRAKHPDNCKRYEFAVAAGLIAGEGLMGVVKAVMTLAGVPIAWDTTSAPFPSIVGGLF
jgi:OPT family oligopeptide transporter